MLFVFFFAQHLAGSRMELLACELSDGPVELDVGRIEFGLPGLAKSVQALDQSRHFVAVQVTVVVVQFVQLGRILDSCGSS